MTDVTPRPRPRSTQKRPPTDVERADREAFKPRVLLADRRTCIVHLGVNLCTGELQAHHVVTQQQLRAAGRHDLLWDWRNGATICTGAHARHTKGVARIPLSALPARCVAFAAAHGFDAILDRYYDDGGA